MMTPTTAAPRTASTSASRNVASTAASPKMASMASLVPTTRNTFAATYAAAAVNIACPNDSSPV
jgi:hypothetical protein